MLMKQWPIWVFTLLILVVINLQIYNKEQTLKNGRTVLLELAPVDPRSLMQGDYMRLRYAITSQIKEDSGNKGTIILKIDEKQHGTFARLDQGTSPAENEQRLIYRNRSGHLRLGAESFFFQEGQAALYDKAKFGELKVDKTGNSILTGLRDKNNKRLEPQNKKHL